MLQKTPGLLQCSGKKKRRFLWVCFCLDRVLTAASFLPHAEWKAVCSSHQWQEHSCAMTSELSYEQFCLLSSAGKVNWTLNMLGWMLLLCNMLVGATFLVGVRNICKCKDLKYQFWSRKWHKEINVWRALPLMIDPHKVRKSSMMGPKAGEIICVTSSKSMRSVTFSAS